MSEEVESERSSTQDTWVADPADAVVSGIEATARPEKSLSEGALGKQTHVRSGDHVGRYVVLSRLGAGAMGVVLAAFDPQLDRKVAIKLLKHRPKGGTETDQARLQREAQALAKLNHTNVVAVYDVGLHGDAIFVAMEFVDGVTLRQWSEQRQRSWREVLDVMLAAGRGLSAAHAEGLIHRDFKPDNVMIGHDGRVRVMDFGLARAHDDAPTSAPSVASLQGLLDTPLTQTGAIMGTPAYMAPEQFMGGGVSARSDQFAFCVALFEALYGVRPFRGESAAQIAFAVSQGNLIASPRGHGVPGWIDATIRKGLAAEPDARHQDMAALLAVLESGASRGARRAWAAVGLVGVLGVAGGFAYQSWDEANRVAICEDAGASTLAAWNDEEAAALRARIAATGVSYADGVGNDTAALIDERVIALRGAVTEACTKHDVARTWDDDLRDRATWCLEHIEMRADALLSALERLDAADVLQLPSVAAQFPKPDACLDEIGLLRMPAPPEDRDAVREVRRRLSEAHALEVTGDYAKSIEVSTKAVETAQSIDWPPLQAEAHQQLGVALDRAGKYERATAELETAYYVALEADARDIAADIAVALIDTVGYKRGQHEAGLAWARHAEALLGVTEKGEDAMRGSTLEANLAAVHLSAGHYDEAERLFRRTVEARRESGSASATDLATALNNLATVRFRTGHQAEARDLFSEVVAVYEDQLGPTHPNVAAGLSNLAVGHRAVGDYEAAEAALNRALSIYEGFAPNSRYVAAALVNLGNVHLGKGDLEAAQAAHEKALAVRIELNGEQHAVVAESLAELGLIARRRGNKAEGREYLRRAVEIGEAVLEPDHPNLADYEHRLAIAQMDDEEFGAARERLDRALAIRREKFGPKSAEVGKTLGTVADLHVRMGDPAAGLSAARESVEILGEAEVGPDELSAAKMSLARILVALQPGEGGDPDRAVALVREAKASLEGAAGDHTATIAEMDAWLAQR